MAKQIAIFLVLILGFSNLYSQKDFKGSITYKVTLEGENINPQLAAMIPGTLVYNILGDKMQVKMELAMGSVTTLSDVELGEMWVVSEFQGQQNVKHITKEQIDAEKAKMSDPDVRLVDETKEIAGLACKKAIVSQEINGEEVLSVIYYAPKYKSSVFELQSKEMKDIPGLPLQFEQQMEGATMKMVATIVNKKKPSKELFVIPEKKEAQKQ